MTTASQLSQDEREKLGARFRNTLQSLDVSPKHLEIAAAHKPAAYSPEVRWLAYKLGVAETTVYRWCSGDVEVPRYAAAFVEVWRALSERQRRALMTPPKRKRKG